jgi:hypothetical protein
MSTNKKKTNEGLTDMAASAEADHELQMARSQLYKIASYAIKLHEMMKQVTDPNGIEAWQAAKITKASDYMGAVYHDLEYKINVEQGGELGAEAGEIAVGEGEQKKYGKMKETSDPYVRKLRNQLTEKAKSKSQQRAAGIALKHKREGTNPKEGSAAAEMMSMSKSDLEDYAGTKHKGKPDHVDEASSDYDSYGTFTGGQDRPGGKPSARDRGIDDDGDQAFIDKQKAKKQAREDGAWYIFIDGKVWKKGGKPVEFNGRKHANSVGLKLRDKLDGKQITISPNPDAAPKKQ